MSAPKYSPELTRFLIQAKFDVNMDALLNRHPTPPPSRPEQPADALRRPSYDADDEPDTFDLMMGAPSHLDFDCDEDV